MKIIIVILIIFLVLIGGCGSGSNTQCTGGRIVNTLSEENCYENETNVGEMEGLKCPCICCMPKK